MKTTKRLKYWVPLFIVLTGVVAPLLGGIAPAQKAFALNESYSWRNFNTLNVSGGDLKANYDLKLRNGSNLPGTPELFSWPGAWNDGPTDKSGCYATITVTVNGNQLTVSHPMPKERGSGVYPAGVKYCWDMREDCTLGVFNCHLVPAYPGVSERYNYTTTASGNRGNPGEETETLDQQTVIVTLKSSLPAGSSPDQITMGIKRAGEYIQGVGAIEQHDVEEDLTDGAFAEPASARPVKYEGSFYLQPGEYEVCHQILSAGESEILPCQKFTKVKFEPLILSFAPPPRTDSINVNVDLKYSASAGESKTVGPINLSLLTAAGGQAVATTSTNSFTQEGCDPDDLTPSPICQVQGQSSSNAITLKGAFLAVEPGTYRICITGTEICKDVTKVAGANTTVNLTADGLVGQALADGTIAGQGTAGIADPLCDEKNSGSLGWWFCSVGQTILDAVRNLDHWILRQLEINTDKIFVDGGAGSSGRAFKQAWNIFRNLAYALFIILGLVMIISQIMGLDLFDAYTIRKMLPKLVAAAIFIPLLWPILKLLFEMSNNAGSAIYELILAPFGGVGGAISLEALFLTTATVGGVGVAAFFAVGGWGVFLAVMASILLSLLSALVILAVRDIVAYALIIASPVAVICATFEPFKKIFTFWKTFLLTILLAIPAISAVLATSKVAAKISMQTDPTWGVVLAAVFLAAGYALFWKIFQALDKVSGQVGNLIGNVTGKAQKALSEYRGNALKKRWEAGIEGRRNLGFFGAGNMFTALGRRARMTDEAGLGAWGIGRRGRAKYAEGVRTMRAQVAAKMLEQDKDRSGGDDDAMLLLRQRGMTENRFIRDYAAMAMRGDPTLSQADATQRARNALGTAQTSLGARVGTDSMRVAAQKALLKSNTSYRRNLNGEEMSFEEMTRTMYQDVGELVQQGLITASDGGAMIKANSARLDRAGVGFGTAIARVDQVSRGQDLSTEQIRSMSEEVLTGSSAYQLIGQRHETVRMMAPEMLRAAGDAYRADGNRVGPQFIRRMAMSASWRDAMPQVSPLISGLMADGLEGQEIAGRTISQWEEELRDNLIFQEYRREYARQAEADAARRGEVPGGPPGPPGAPGVPR